MDSANANALLVKCVWVVALANLLLLLFNIVLRLRAALPQHRRGNHAKRMMWSSSLLNTAPPTMTFSSDAKGSTLHSRTVPSSEFSTVERPIAHAKCTATIFLGSGGHTAEMLQLVSGLDMNKYSPRHYVVGWDDDSSVEKVHRLEAAFSQSVGISLPPTAAEMDGRRLGDEKEEVLDGYTVHRIPRSRHVHQSMLTTPFTLAKSLFVAMPLIKRLTCLRKREKSEATSMSQPLSVFTPSPLSASASSSAILPALASGPGSAPLLSPSPALALPSQARPETPRRSVLLMNGPGTCLALAVAVIGARMLGVPDELTPDLIFVESFARVKTLSLAGKLLYPLCDVFLVQWPGLTKTYPKALYIGTLV